MPTAPRYGPDTQAIRALVQTNQALHCARGYIGPLCDKVDELRAHVRDLHATIDTNLQEIHDYEQLHDDMVTLITSIANALKGEPLPGTGRHDWHDLPQVATDTVNELLDLRARLRDRRQLKEQRGW